MLAETAGSTSGLNWAFVAVSRAVSDGRGTILGKIWPAAGEAEKDPAGDFNRNLPVHIASRWKV